MKPATSLKSKNIIITGATSGIGYACAESLSAEGANLFLLGRRKDRLEALSHELEEQFHIQAPFIAVDVRDRGLVNRAVETIQNTWNTIDGLINNAGLAAGHEPIASGSVEDWEQMIDTNVKGLLYITRQILPLMLQQGSGHIVNIGSISGHDVYAGGGVYCCTKYAVRALTETLRRETLGSGVRISAVDPGMTYTEFSDVRFKGDEARANAVYRGIEPLAASDVAEAILFCLTRPTHVNVGDLILWPTDQASVRDVHRKSNEDLTCSFV